MLTEVGLSVKVPVVSRLFSDSLMAVTFRVTAEPAGITTLPALSFTSLAIVAVTVSPTLFLCERISAVVAAVNEAPAGRLLLATGAAGVGVEALGDGVRGVAAAGRLGWVGVRGAGSAAVAVGRSFSSALVSTGASCRSRLRLSAAAVSPVSPRPQATTAANVSAAIMLLDI
jgi:hypothetical protein